MQIQAITQEAIADTDEILTRVVINQVASQCILVRLMMKALGRPGVDNDMEIMGAGDEWIFLWTQPQLTIEQTRELITGAIAPSV